MRIKKCCTGLSPGYWFWFVLKGPQGFVGKAGDPGTSGNPGPPGPAVSVRKMNERECFCG